MTMNQEKLSARDSQLYIEVLVYYQIFRAWVDAILFFPPYIPTLEKGETAKRLSTRRRRCDTLSKVRLRVTFSDFLTDNLADSRTILGLDRQRTGVEYRERKVKPETETRQVRTVSI